MHPIQTSYHPFHGLFGKHCTRTPEEIHFATFYTKLGIKLRNIFFYRTVDGFQPFDGVSDTFSILFCVPITGGGGGTDLMHAALYGDFNKVQSLVLRGAAVDDRDLDGKHVDTYANTFPIRQIIMEAEFWFDSAKIATFDWYIHYADTHHIQWLQGLPFAQRAKCVQWATTLKRSAFQEGFFGVLILRTRKLPTSKNCRYTALLLSFLALPLRAEQTLAAMKYL